MLHIRECLVEIKDRNLDTEKRTIFSEGPVCVTKYTTTASLFLALQREYGKCVSRQYRDVTVDGKPVSKQIGWVFEKRMPYEDAWRIKKGQPKTFLQETWVEVFSEAPVNTVTYTHPW